MKKKSAVVSIEGPDSCGKSTQAKLITEHFREVGQNVRLFKVPFNDRLTHKIIYGMLFNGLAREFPTFFQLVQFVNKLIFQVFVLSWAVFKYDIIVLDRWVMSARVYGDADGASPLVTRTLNKLLLKPDSTVLITGPRRKREGIQDSYEKDSLYQDLVVELYKDEAKRSSGDVIPCNVNLGPIDLSEHLTYQLWLHNIPDVRKTHCEC